MFNHAPSPLLSCRYVNEVSVLSVLLDFAPTLLLLGATYWWVPCARGGVGFLLGVTYWRLCCAREAGWACWKEWSSGGCCALEAEFRLLLAAARSSARLRICAAPARGSRNVWRLCAKGPQTQAPRSNPAHPSPFDACASWWPQLSVWGESDARWIRLIRRWVHLGHAHVGIGIC